MGRRQIMKSLPGDINPTLRTIAGLSSIAPVALGGIAVGLATQSRRNGVNFFSAIWPKLVLTVGGVELNVVGAENLTAIRPAVFIFNHRNNFDVFITAALVGQNWTAVGKKELENDPIAGTIGRIVDAAFIDRDDHSAAVDGLRKVEELARNGLSIIIAPEGTRTATDTVGEFKKGPFRIAMSAHVPIVPVVIRNAEAIAGHQSSLLHAGTVDVAVLPPISVADWTLAGLNERIASVRKLYVDALTSWPDIVESLSNPTTGSS
jgi:putative phosphoserine phosphatase / 1-acylglycerol-3-phosphate O-acyltransferase